jgi:hypothetical protein
MIPHRPIPLMVLPLVVFWAVWCHATQIVPSTLEYMTGFSDAIVVGHVVDKHSYWQERKIVTSITLDVEQHIKNLAGEASSTVEIVIPGGKVGDIALKMDQAPVFEIGEKVMLFLKEVQDGYFPFGFNYGVYKIYWSDADQKEFITGPLFSAPEHYDLITMEESKNRDPSGRRELEAFLKEVQELVK